MTKRRGGARDFSRTASGWRPSSRIGTAPRSMCMGQTTWGSVMAYPKRTILSSPERTTHVIGSSYYKVTQKRRFCAVRISDFAKSLTRKFMLLSKGLRGGAA